ncbi:MAG: hypothetical protein ACRCSP_03060 [Rhodoglobus sp.]
MIPMAVLALTFSALITTSTPTPFPAYEGDVNLVTPGVIGFAATFLVALSTVLLLVDMVRRVRRVRYRGEIREKLMIEQAEELSAEADAAGQLRPPHPLAQEQPPTAPGA